MKSRSQERREALESPSVFRITAGLAAVILMLAALAAPPAVAAGVILNVRDFGAIPNDGKDDAAAIQRAFDAAARQHAQRLEFEAGRYDIVALEAPSNQAHIALTGAGGMEMRGAVDAQGEPATRLVRHWEMPAERVSKRILFVGESPDFTLRNFLFDNDPQYATAGRVVEKTADSVTVEILEGLPRIDGVICYCANAWDLATRKLKHVPSVTYGGDVDKRPAELTWRVVEGGNGRRMKLNSAFVTQQMQVGDGLSWNFGYNGYQVSTDQCDRLHLENLRTVNAIGFAMCSGRSKGLTSKRVVVKPDGNQLAVGPRDGWKLYWCDGRVRVEDAHIEGVRWDGQNVHGRFIELAERRDDRTLVTADSPGRPLAFKSGDVIGFWDGLKVERRTLASSAPAPRTNEAGTTGRGRTRRAGRGGGGETELRFTEPLPAFVKAGTLTYNEAWDIDHYELVNCTFVRIAGSASLLRNTHALIEGCRFDNIMYPAVMVGASVDEREGTFPQDVTVRGCTFSDSGWRPRQDAFGMIGINSGAATLPYMGKVTVTDTTFRDGELGLDIAEIREARITGNRFQNVKTTHRAQEATVGHLVFEDNRVEP